MNTKYTPVHNNFLLLQIVSHVAVACYIKASRHSVTVRLNVTMGKTSDRSDFERGMVDGTRVAGSSISETSAFLGFSRTTVSKDSRKWCDIQKTSSQRQSCGRKQLVDERSKENGKNRAS